MKIIIKIIVCFVIFIPYNLFSQNLRMKATQFGICSDGITMNTNSIQMAIDYIHEHGGGTLEFYVGRYLTGGLVLKSNVYIYLDEAATLVGSTNPYDYRNNKYSALIMANNQENIGIIGKGGIDGRGRELVNNIISQVHGNILECSMKVDRPGCRPNLLSFNNCKNIRVKDIILKNSSCWVQNYSFCEDLIIDNISVISDHFWNNDGLDINNCVNVKILNSYINSSDDGICFKSEGSNDYTKICKDIEVRNCTIRSSANGIKFGSYTVGGYKNIRIINNKVYNTYRSAINIASPDGGNVENVFVDSLLAVNVGNGIYLRLNARSNTDRKGTMKNITIQNAEIKIAADKADAGYEYEGPVEDLPRNISPCGIMGLPDRIIENVLMKNIHISYPGGGDMFYAKSGISSNELDSIPEKEDAYPDYSKFLELPAWGFFIRHVSGLKFENVTLTALKKDYRPSIVMIDVKQSLLEGVIIKEPTNKAKNQIVQYKTKDIVIKKLSNLQ